MPTATKQKPKAVKQSTVMRLMQLTWKSANKSTGHSWQRLNGSMRSALELAVTSGMEFELDDFKNVLANFRSGYWIGDDGGEWLYSLAVAESNQSACLSFEAYRGHKPFIADGVRPAGGTERARERLAIGSAFQWRGKKVTVTSFAANGESLTACSYKRIESGDYGRDKIESRFTITPKDIIADRAQRKLKLAEAAK